MHRSSLEGGAPLFPSPEFIFQKSLPPWGHLHWAKVTWKELTGFSQKSSRHLEKVATLQTEPFQTRLPSGFRNLWVLDRPASYRLLFSASSSITRAHWMHKINHPAAPHSELHKIRHFSCLLERCKAYNLQFTANRPTVACHFLFCGILTSMGCSLSSQWARPS